MKFHMPAFQSEQSLPFAIFRLNSDESETEEQNVHRHAHFEIVYVLKGHGACCIDLNHYRITDQMIFLIPEGHVHFFQPEGLIEGFRLSLSREFCHHISGFTGLSVYQEILCSLSGACRIEKSEEQEEIKNILTSVFRETQIHELGRPGILAGWLKIFLLYLKDMPTLSVSKSEYSKYISVVKTFYQLLERDFLKKKMVIDYANGLFMTPSYLNEIVKRVTGHTVSHHIQQRIILEAKRMATYSNSTMKEIAYGLGFEDIAYFSKFFKMFAGINFRNYKTLCCQQVSFA